MKRKGYKGIGPHRAARSAADEDRRILCEASAQGTDALRVASQRLLKEAADLRVSAEVSEREWASRTGLDHLAPRGDVAVVASDAAAAGQSAGGDAPEVDEEVGRPSDLDSLDPHLQPRTLQIQSLQT